MQLKPHFFFLLAVLSLGFLSCSKDDPTPQATTFANWQPRNDADFENALQHAKHQIATAQATHGNEWEKHCPYRLFPSYLLAEGGVAKSTDTIIVRIDNEGKGSAVQPLYTDTVQINYQGHTLATPTHPKGILFDHSGRLSDSTAIFHPHLSQPSKFHVGSLVPGFTTALLHMRHLGDKWQVYIPYRLAYNKTATQHFPAYTNLIFDIELKAVYRKGRKTS